MKTTLQNFLRIFILFMLTSSTIFAATKDHQCIEGYGCGSVTISPASLECSPGGICGPLKITNHFTKNIQFSLPTLPDGIGTAEFVAPCAGTIAANGGTCDINLIIDTNAALGTEFDFFVPVQITTLTPAIKVHVSIKTKKVTTAYVTTGKGNTVDIIDLATKALSTVTDTGSSLNNPFSIAITPDGAYAYVTNYTGNSVSIIDLNNNTITQNVTDAGFMLNNPRSIAITPDGAHAYVANASGDSVSIIDLSNNTVTQNVTDTGYLLNNPLSIAITPDGAYAYVANRVANTVSIIDLRNNTITQNVTDTGSRLDLPNSIAITPDGDYAYVANTSSVSIIDLSNNTITENIDDSRFPFSSPKAIAITPDSTTAYITNAHKVSIVDLTQSPAKVVDEVSGLADTGADIALN